MTQKLCHKLSLPLIYYTTDQEFCLAEMPYILCKDKDIRGSTEKQVLCFIISQYEETSEEFWIGKGSSLKESITGIGFPEMLSWCQACQCGSYTLSNLA